MLDPFLAIVETLDLSRSEMTTVERYRSDPRGRSFLPMSDVLRTHQKRDEAIELLIRGVVEHPSFSAARVVLARELYTKGLLQESLSALLSSPVSLEENALAMKLFFRLYTLSFDFVRAEEVRRSLDMRKMLDDESREISDLIGLKGFEGAQQHLVKEFRSRGIEPRLFSGRESVMADTRDLDFDGDAMYSSAADDYSQVALNQVFSGTDESSAEVVELGGVSLDSTTLAEIYEKQRLFGKALEVYRRLMRINPSSDFLRQQLRRLAKLVYEQRREDLEIDASIVDEMEQIEVIDRHIRFYTKILNRLS